MFPPRPTHLLHLLLREVIREGDTVLDATAGNGHDTVFLAGLVGESGNVVAIDIQALAIESTRRRLVENGLERRVELHQASHADLGRYVPRGNVSAAVFNLGYLPGSDHGVITRTETTLQALVAALDALQPDGVIAVVCYPGHDGGAEEAGQVERFLMNMPELRLAKYDLPATRLASPFLLVGSKKVAGPPASQDSGFAPVRDPD